MSQNGGLPIVGVTAEPKILIEGAGNRSSFVFRLSEPAPNGGLTLNVGFIEEDGAFGDDTLETENVASFDENDLGLISSVTIEAGKTEAKLTFVSLGDDILEDDESSTLFLIETPNYKIDPNAREATIIETDVPVVSMSVEAPTIDENGAGIFPEGPGNSASFVFTLSKPAPAGGLTLNLATFEQDGAFGDDTISTENIDDFSENALGTINSITITEGATTARFTLNSIGDDILEGPEETTIFLLDAIGYTPNPDASQATLIEVDDPNFVPSTPEPSLIVGVTAEPEILIEGAGNKSSFVFRLSEPAPEGGLILNVGFIEEDGASGDDALETENVAAFEANELGLTSSVTIEAGKTEARFTAVSLGDDILEDDESSTLFLIETPNYKVDPNAREATIIETDVPVVSISVEAPTIDENGAGIFLEGPGNSASFVFTLSKPAPAGGLTLNLATFEQDGAFGDDTISLENIDKFSENALGTINSITITEGATTARFTLNSIGDEILEGPEETTIFLLEAIGYTPNPDASQATLIETDIEIPGTTGGNTDQIVSFRLEDVFIPAQGGSVADTIIIIDQKDGLESFPDIVPVAEFVKDYLNTAPNEDDFLQDISTNLSQAILDNNSLGLSGTVDSISVQLDRKPAGILPFEFITTATNTHTGTTDQVVTINLQDVLVPVQGGTVADVSIIIDQKDGLQTFPDLIPVANFTEEFLTTYDNPDDFYQDISNNLTQAILSNPDLGLAGTVDSVSVQLNREAAGIVPFNFSSQSISTPDTDTSTDLPVVSLSVSPELVSENNEQFTLTLNLSKPAPAGGLEVIFSETDSDNAFGDITSPPELTNASNFQSLNPVGEELARSVITIAEGATTASLSWKTLADSQTEGKETTTYTLLSNEGYQVDTDNSVDTLTILDTSTDVPTFTGTANNDVLPGTSVAEIINGLAGDDIIYGNGGGDIMFGGDDNDQIFGTIDADYMNGGDGDDTMYGNGGEDTLFGGNGDNLIYGGSQADTIITGDGDDTIYANGGGDNINSGAGLDTVWLGNGEATVVLDTGLGYDIIKNFQLGATTLQVASKDNLSFVDSADGAQILDGVDLLAVVSWNSADTFTNNADQIFVVA